MTGKKWMEDGSRDGSVGVSVYPSIQVGRIIN